MKTDDMGEEGKKGRRGDAKYPEGQADWSGNSADDASPRPRTAIRQDLALSSLRCI